MWLLYYIYYELCFVLSMWHKLCYLIHSAALKLKMNLLYFQVIMTEKKRLITLLTASYRKTQCPSELNQLTESLYYSASKYRIIAQL